MNEKLVEIEILKEEIRDCYRELILALIGGAAAFLVGVYFLVQNFVSSVDPTSVVLSIIEILLAGVLFDRAIIKAQEKDRLSEKLKQYRSESSYSDSKNYKIAN